MNSTKMSPCSFPRSTITGCRLPGLDGSSTPSSSGQSFITMPRLANSRSMISSASPSDSMTGGFIETQPKAPRPSPATATGSSGQTSVAGWTAAASALAGFSAFGASGESAVFGSSTWAASCASAFIVIATVPRDATTDLSRAQRAGGRARSSRPMSEISG